MDAVDTQLREVQGLYPGAECVRGADGARFLVVPCIPLPPGWSSELANIRVAVPIGFPHVKPDCFYTDDHLKLASGGEPTASRVQVALGGSFRWFSWHLTSWDPVRGSLAQYVRFCERRLRDAR
jgi:hypothetical protein